LDGEHKIYQFNKNNTLKRMRGAAKKIAVDGEGNPWTVNIYGEIHQMKQGKFVRVKGRAREIAAGADGRVYILTREKNS